MQQTPSFYSKQIISKEELKVWDESLRELFGNVLKYNRSTSQVGGILDAIDTNTLAFINDFFNPQLGSVASGGFNTLKIGQGRGILNHENATEEKIAGLLLGNDTLKKQMVTLLKWNETDNIPIDGISGYNSGEVVYVGFVPIWNPLEQGICAISSNNQVTIVGGDFSKLRGQSTKNPTKVRFYQESGSPASNDDIYEVISVVNDTTIIISGSVNSESGLKMLVVGSYDLSAQGNLSDKAAYRSANGKLTFSTVSGGTDILSAGGFLICSLTFATGGAFTINDLRIDNLYSFIPKNIVYTNLPQTITGQKKFTTNSPIFAIPTVDKPDVSFTTPLTLPTTGLTTTLTISLSEGNVFQIESWSSSSDHRNVLSNIVINGGYVAGTRLYLYVAPAGAPLTLQPSIVATGIASYDKAGHLSGGAIPPGTMLEFWADTALNWRLVNYIFDAQATIQPDGTSTPQWTSVIDFFSESNINVGLSGNSVKYIREGNTVYLNIDQLNYSIYPIHFSIPFTLPTPISETYKTAGIIEISTGGVVTVTANVDSGGSIIAEGNQQKIITLHL